MADSQEIAAALRAVRDGESVPAHVRKRLAALSADEEVVYADVRKQQAADASATASGVVVMFTARLVLLAEYDNSQVHTNRAGGEQLATVTVRCWSRRTLMTLSIDPDATDSRNTDAGWDGQWIGKWPPRSCLTLTYDGQPPLRLPLAERDIHRDESWPALPILADSLLDDLAATSAGSA